MAPQLLAPYSSPVLDEHTPTWSEFASRSIFDFLTERGVQVGDPNLDDNLLFIGETSPDLHFMGAQRKRFSILLFQPHLLTSLSYNVIKQVDIFYVINSEHRYLIKQVLEERFGQLRFRVKQWRYFPKPFDPPQRTRKLYGIIEPDFNTNSIFDKLYSALDSIFTSALYALDFDLAFYTLKQETNDMLRKKFLTANKIAIYHLPDPVESPLHDVTLMPDGFMAIDTYKYNPVLSGCAQVVPVIKPEWTNPQLLERTLNSLITPSLATNEANVLITDFVNKIRRVEELEVSPRITDQLARTSILGELYGDYSKFKRFPSGS